MMKTLKLFFGLIAVFILMTLGGCSHEDPETPDPVTEYDEAYYAAHASVSSYDSGFSSSDEGGTIAFGTSGGEVVVTVDCGCDWTVENTASDLFTTSLNATSLTVMAGQNTIEEELRGTIKLVTAGQRIEFANITVTQNAYGAPNITVDSNECLIPAVGSLTAFVGVEASADWSIENTADWLVVEKTDTGISLTASENENVEERRTVVVLNCTDGIKAASESITVIQSARAYIHLSTAEVRLRGLGGTASVTIESNYDWDYSYDTSSSWFSVESDGEILKVTVSENMTDDAREDSVVITAGDGVENNAQAIITIAQSTYTEPLILTYTISSANTTVILPLCGTVDCAIDWGDGSDTELVTDVLPTHVYSAKGEFNVSIEGTVTSLSSESFSTNTSPVLTLTSVEQWGRTGLTDMSYAFYCYFSLTSLPADTSGSFAEVTSFSWAFCALTSLKTIPADIFAYCSKATNFEYVFANCPLVKEIPEGLFDNCAEATSLRDVFNYSQTITSVPAGLFSNCKKVTDFTNVFYGCIALETVPSGLFDNCTKVESFKQAFAICSSLSTLPDGLFDKCTEVTDFSGLFYQCSSLSSLPSGLFDHNTKVTTFAKAFYQCEVLQAIPEGLFDNCPQVESFQWTFGYCKIVESIPDGLFDKHTKVTDFSYTFDSCKGVTSLPANLFANNHEVTTFNRTFENCSVLTTIADGVFAGCSKVTDFTGVFSGCNKLTAIPSGLFDDCTEATLFYRAFMNCWALTSVAEDLFSNCKKITNVKQAFYSAYTLAWDGESPYDLIEINGQEVKVHLYERLNDEYKEYYPDASSMEYSECFFQCYNMTDYGNLPLGWY